MKSQMTLNAQSLNSVIKAGSGSVYTKNSMLSAVAAADGSMSLVYNESDDAASSTNMIMQEIMRIWLQDSMFLAERFMK